MTAIKVVKLGIRFDPPTLAMVYHDPIGKCDRLHRIDLSTSLFSPPDVAADNLIRESPEYLSYVNRPQLVKLLQKARYFDGMQTQGLLSIFESISGLYRFVLQAHPNQHRQRHQSSQDQPPPWRERRHCLRKT